jgi:hypothetical protein
MAPRTARKPGRAAPRIEIGIENFNTPAVPTSPVTGVLSNTACSVNVKQLAEITAGLWYNLYKGPYGRLTGGLQDECIHRDRFPGLAGAIPAAGLAQTPRLTRLRTVDELRDSAIDAVGLSGCAVDDAR